jgi:hypothetical protein
MSDHSDEYDYEDDFVDAESVGSISSSKKSPRGRASPNSSSGARRVFPAAAPPTTKPQTQTQTQTLTQTQTHLPGSSGLVAEVMLDEISREVVRLRNQQRAVLSERREVVKEKRARADERRRKYEEELKRFSDAAVAAEAGRRAIEAEKVALEKQLKSVEKSAALAGETTKVYEREARRLEEAVAGLNEELRGAEKKLRESRNTLDETREQHSTEIAQLKAQLLSEHMLAESMRRSNEAAEKRFAEEKAKMPAHQQQSYDEAMARLSSLESSLKDREYYTSAEEARRLAAVDALKKEANEQLNRHRQRVEADLASERKELGQLMSQLEASRSHWDLAKAQELAALDALRADVRRKEQELDEARSVLQQQRAELEVGQRLIEPSIRAAERDREDARALKAQADRVLFAAEEHASSILAAERGLVRREQVVMAAEKGLETARATLVADRRVLLGEAAKQRSAQQALDTERFRLHQCSMELALQVGTVKKGINQLVRGHGHGPQSALGHHEDENVPPPPSHSTSFPSSRQQDDYGYALTASEGAENGENGDDEYRPSPLFAMDPSVIHTAIALQDVTKTLKGISSATASLDPALDNLLGPRRFSARRDELQQQQILSQPFAFAQASVVLQQHQSSGSEASTIQQKFDSMRSESSRARSSDEVAVSTVRSSVAAAQGSVKSMTGLASKYSSFLGKK